MFSETGFPVYGVLGSSAAEKGLTSIPTPRDLGSCSRLRCRPVLSDLSGKHTRILHMLSTGLVWLNCEPHSSVVALGLTLALEKIRAQVHTGLSRPKIAPSSIIFCAQDAGGASEGVKGLRALYPDSPILVFSVHADLSLAEAALREGARGFVHAGMSPQQIVRAVEVAAEGELAFPRALLGYLLLNEVSEGCGAGPAALTARQVDTLELVGEGLSNTKIAERLSVSEWAIKQRLRAAYKMLGVRSRTAATKLFLTPKPREAGPALPHALIHRAAE
jgi:DNA-binding NarL/FixJ family response regulator